MNLFQYRRHVLSPAQPWLMKARTDAIAPLKSLAAGAEDREVFVFDGANMTSWEAFDDRHAHRFQFPFWYGHNPNAFDDVMRDLSWLEFDRILIIYLNSQRILEIPDKEWSVYTVEMIVESMAVIAEYWSEAIEEGEWWDHPATPFHALFHLPVSTAVDLDLPALEVT